MSQTPLFYVVSSSGKEIGPCEFQRASAMIKEGKIKKNTSIRMEGREEIKKAIDVFPNSFEAVGDAAPPEADVPQPVSVAAPVESDPVVSNAIQTPLNGESQDRQADAFVTTCTSFILFIRLFGWFWTALICFIQSNFEYGSYLVLPTIIFAAMAIEFSVLFLRFMRENIRLQSKRV